MSKSRDRVATRDEDHDLEHTPGETPGVLQNLEDTLKGPLWRPVWLKAASVFAGMLGLTAIGMASTLQEGPSVDSPSQVTEGSTWLAGSPLALAAPAAKPATAEPASPTAAHAHPPPSPNGTRSTADALQTPEKETPDEQPEPAPPGLTNDGKVILNTANLDELQRLPGVGRKRAEKILELRDRLGRFKRPTDLLRIRGIGVKSLRKMLPHLVLDPPAKEPAAEDTSDGATAGAP